MHITDAIVLDDREITERFVRVTRRAGQNVNRDATAVGLRIDIGRSSLPPDLRERLIARALAGQVP
jgi:protein subunit release factor B